MEKMLEQNVANPSEEKENQSASKLRVYRKKSNFKDSRDGEFWYSATRSDGNSIILKFKGITPPDSPAFEIGEVKGQLKSKEVVVKGETYINFTYYITECNFYDIEGVDLPL